MTLGSCIVLLNTVFFSAVSDGTVYVVASSLLFLATMIFPFIPRSVLCGCIYIDEGDIFKASPGVLSPSYFQLKS